MKVTVTFTVDPRELSRDTVKNIFTGVEQPFRSPTGLYVNILDSEVEDIELTQEELTDEGLISPEED